MGDRGRRQFPSSLADMGPHLEAAIRLPLGCLNTKHCLEIQVTLTEELGDMPPPFHSWMAPLVEDML